MTLAVPPLFAALDQASSILIAGAGGGFDVYAGLPLAIALRDKGAQVHLANLSFSQLELLETEAWPAPNVAAVTPTTATRIARAYPPLRWSRTLRSLAY